jgi:GntR family transcriptional regulator of vanillate catabolism
MLGVSRTPLREALRVLERDGLLRSLPSGTVEVVKLTRDEAVQLSLFREVIDGLAARLTVETGGGQALAARLRMRMTEMESSLASVDMRRWLGAHVAFHSEVVAASGNVWVKQLLSLVRMGSQSVYLVQGSPPDPSDPRFAAYQRYLAEHIEYHRDLLIEIERNDPDAAERAARWHIRRTRRWLLEAPSGQPQT